MYETNKQQERLGAERSVNTIGMELTEVEQAVESLDKNVESMAQKLEPFMRPPRPEPVSETGNKDAVSSRSNVGDRLKQLRNNIANINGRIAYLMGRVDE